jgi:ubiquitin-conjugating enzyme E2 J1
MSTAGQFSSKNPTIKRILKEASELANAPSSDYAAAPLETDLFEWHFTLRGPPAPSPFEGGLYHGRIVLPPAYPLKPPSFRFLTPTGRFEVNREICLSISGHHEETWQPAWGIRTALVAIRSFMDTDAKGQLGGMYASEEVRRRFAGQSSGWRCGACGKSNVEVMAGQDRAVEEAGGDKKVEVVPEGLRLAYREDLGKQGDGNAAEGSAAVGTGATPASSAVPSTIAPTRTVPAHAVAAQVQRPAARQDDGIPAWIDKAIMGIVAVLAALVWARYIA